jgi:hypothetical protein
MKGSTVFEYACNFALIGDYACVLPKRHNGWHCALSDGHALVFDDEVEVGVYTADFPVKIFDSYCKHLYRTNRKKFEDMKTSHRIREVRRQMHWWYLNHVVSELKF